MKRAALLLFLSLVLPLGADKPDKFTVLMDKGEGADLRGKTIKAAKRFEAAIAAAPTDEQRVEARFAYIGAVTGATRLADLDAETSSEIDAQYKIALVEAKGKQSFKAHSDYGLFLLARGKPVESVAVFSDGEKSLGEVDPPVAARYLYNFAEAHANNGEFDTALATTQRALELDPAFDGAVGKLFNLLAKMAPQAAALHAVSVIDFLLDRQQPASAGRWLAHALDPARDKWHEQPQVAAAFAQLFLRWAASNGVAYEEVTMKWLPLLKEAADEGSGEDEKMVGQLARIFENDQLPLSFEADFDAVFDRWSTPEEHRALSQLAMTAGDAFGEQEKPKRAAERYLAAWRLDPSQLRAVVDLAAQLRFSDIDEGEALFDQLVIAVFGGDGVRSADAVQLVQLHLFMGSIYEDRDLWEPVESVSTATYHFEHALQQYEKWRAGDPKVPPQPGVHAKLANAYQHIGRKAQAWQQYMAAAGASLEQKEYEAALMMLQESALTDHGVTPEESERVEKLLTSIISASMGAPADTQLVDRVYERLWAHPDLDPSSIDISVRDGVVKLAGESREQIEEARLAVAAMKDVKEVQVEVKVPSPPPLP